MNYKKYTRGRSLALLKHNERIYINHKNKSIDPEKSPDNIFVIIDRDRDKDSITYLCDRLKKLNDENRAQGKRGIRKDAITMCEWVITKPDNVKDDMPFFYFTTEFFKERYGKENIISVNIHYDENRPHMHIDFMPITKDGRLCAKDLENKISLSRINDELERYLHERLRYIPHIRKEKDIEIDL